MRPWFLVSCIMTPLGYSSLRYCPVLSGLPSLGEDPSRLENRPCCSYPRGGLVGEEWLLLVFITCPVCLEPRTIKYTLHFQGTLWRQVFVILLRGEGVGRSGGTGDTPSLPLPCATEQGIVFWWHRGLVRNNLNCKLISRAKIMTEENHCR